MTLRSARPIVAGPRAIQLPALPEQRSTVRDMLINSAWREPYRLLPGELDLTKPDGRSYTPKK